MQKWQYMAVAASSDAQGRRTLAEIDSGGYLREVGQDNTLQAALMHLNQLGEQGWDVISVNVNSTATTYLLKRPSQ